MHHLFLTSHHLSVVCVVACVCGLCVCARAAGSAA